VLLTAGESDSRVDPMHARKMTARLQAATSSPRPVLLRQETRAGHGQGKPVSKLLEEWTDVWSFLFAALGIRPRTSKTAP
jgi:prolyl oligopeptidase